MRRPSWLAITCTGWVIGGGIAFGLYSDFHQTPTCEEAAIVWPEGSAQPDGWHQKILTGWAGRADDRREAIYPPGCFEDSWTGAEQ
jgi:hypothetical protein